jgi:hypothetical protein
VLRAIEFPGATQAIAETLTLNGKREVAQDVRVPADAPVTTPYWLAEPALPGRRSCATRR